MYYFFSTQYRKCVKAAGQELLLTKLSNESKVYKIINWTSDKQCESTPEQIELKENIGNFKVKKILWSITQENSNYTVESPVTKK